MKKENQIGISVKQFSEMLGISLPHAYRMVEKGEVPTMKLGSRYIISKKYIDDHLHGFNEDEMTKYILNDNVKVTPHGTHINITINKDKYIVEVNDPVLLVRLASLALQGVLERRTTKIVESKYVNPPPEKLAGKDYWHQQYIKMSEKDKIRLGYKQKKAPNNGGS